MAGQDVSQISVYDVVSALAYLLSRRTPQALNVSSELRKCDANYAKLKKSN